MNKNKDIKDHYQILTMQIVDKMKESLEYKTPWMVCDFPPYNPVTGTYYKGINFVSLISKGYNDPRFFTYNNLQELSKEKDKKFLIKKGEHGSAVFKAIQKGIFKKNEKDENEEIAKFWMSVHAGTVFNASQIDGLEPFVEKKLENFESQEEIEKIVEAFQKETGLNIEHQDIKNPHYTYSNDTIYIPLKENFKEAKDYYNVLLNLIGQSTVHQKRLNRVHKDQDEKKKSFEFLVGELSSYFLGARIHLPYQAEINEQQISYLKLWVKDLENDKMLIFKAASKANQVVDYILKIKKEYFHEIDEPMVEEKPVKKLKI